MRVVLVTRQGCHLCDQALEVLRGLGTEPEIADVDADDDLYRLYDWRVPVVLIDGAVAAEGKVERSGLQRALRAGPGPDKT
jgi:predicted thioredoxin/glutaredoxin